MTESKILRHVQGYELLHQMEPYINQVIILVRKLVVK